MCVLVGLFYGRMFRLSVACSTLADYADALLIAVADILPGAKDLAYVGRCRVGAVGSFAPFQF